MNEERYYRYPSSNGYARDPAIIMPFLSSKYILPLKYAEYGVYADLITIYPKPYSIHLRGTIGAVRMTHRSLIA